MKGDDKFMIRGTMASTANVLNQIALLGGLAFVAVFLPIGWIDSLFRGVHLDNDKFQVVWQICTMFMFACFLHAIPHMLVLRRSTHDAFLKCTASCVIIASFIVAQILGQTPHR